MKFYKKCFTLVPFFNTEADGKITLNKARMTFTPNEGEGIDRRFMKREIRKWAKRALGRTIHTDELRVIVSNIRCSV